MENRNILIGLLGMAVVLSLAWVFLVVAPGDREVNSMAEGLAWIVLLFALPALSAILLVKKHSWAHPATLLFAALLLWVSLAAFSYRLQSFAEVVISSVGVILALALLYFLLPFFSLAPKAKA